MQFKAIGSNNKIAAKLDGVPFFLLLRGSCAVARELSRVTLPVIPTFYKVHFKDHHTTDLYLSDQLLRHHPTLRILKLQIYHLQHAT